MTSAWTNILDSQKTRAKYKGRVVFGGHDVRNEAGLQVLFDDGGSGASFISASKLLDAVAMLPG